MAYKTVFGSLDNFSKGRIDIINDDPKHYVFSNLFEVAKKSKPWEKVAVGINQEYVLEAIRAEGQSDGIRVITMRQSSAWMAILK